ncbi:hypothetical protein [Thalassospira povalilytica]|uniref:hypothetical protein n=1 Tax=Thalassospira povalilytica TaxID=732237 RepID=UPI003AA8EA53
MKIRIHNIKNIWLRRIAIVPMYLLTVPLALCLLVLYATWEILCDLGFSIKQNFSEVVVDFVGLHLDIGKLWRAK